MVNGTKRADAQMAGKHTIHITMAFAAPREMRKRARVKMERGASCALEFGLVAKNVPLSFSLSSSSLVSRFSHYKGKEHGGFGTLASRLVLFLVHVLFGDV